MEVWEDAAPDGAALTAVVAAIVVAVMLGAIVGPGLRAERRSAQSAKGDRRRLVASIAIAVIAAGMWLVLWRMDAVS